MASDAEAISRYPPRMNTQASEEAGEGAGRAVEGKAPSAYSGRSASTHRSRAPASLANDEAGLPVLPDELLAALSREPPSTPSGPPLGGRTSLAADRPTLDVALGTTEGDPLRLPPVAPQSPFSLAYPHASPSAAASPTTPRPPPHSPGRTSTSAVGGFSANRTDASPPALLAQDPHESLPSAATPHFARSPSSSPESVRATPTVSPSKRNVFKAFSFGRPRASQPPTPAAGYALPPNLAPASADVSAGDVRAASPWSRVADAPPALATTSAAPVSATPHAPSAPLATTQEEPSPRQRARARTDSSATTPSLNVDDDDAHLEPREARWSAWPGAAAEQYTRDLRGVRRGSAGSVGAPAEQMEEGVPYDEEEDEHEDAYAPPVSHVLSADVTLARRASTLSLRHQLAAFEGPNEPLPLKLPVHVEGGTAITEEMQELARLDLHSIREAAQPGQRSPVSAADFIVAVVGPRNVGKSTVIRRGLKRPPDAPTVLQEDAEGNRVTTSTTSFSISGVRRTIEVLEIDMGLLRYSDEGVVWPYGLPQCEAAMLCYDSTDPNSLSSLSLLLKAFWTRGSDVPLIVLACKAAPPSNPGANATDPKEAAAICNVYGAGIVTLDGGIDDPQRKTKECFNWLIRQILDNRGEVIRSPSSASISPAESRRGSLRNSAPLAYATTSSAPITSRPPSSPLPDPPSATHGPRASRLVRTDSLPLGLSVVQEAPLGANEHGLEQANEPDYEAEAAAAVAAMLASVVAGEEDEPEVAYVPQSPTKRRASEAVEPKSAVPTYESAAPTNHSQEGDSKEEHFQAGVVPYPPPATFERRGSKPQSLDLFFKRDDLVDKFLFASVAGNDEQFVTLFLITFRRFARPYDVLEKLIDRFEFVASKHKTDPLLCRFGQMKLCGVLSTWMQNYPGDFAAPATFSLLEPFLENLLPSGATWIAHYAFELVPFLPSIAKTADPESGWALPDEAQAVAPPAAASSVAHTADATPQPAPMSRRSSLAPSHASSSSLAGDAASASASRLSVPVSLEASEQSPAMMQRSMRETGTLASDDSNSVLARNRVPSSAVLVDLSNAIVEMREQDIATQITRLAWAMFAGMSPRDLMRHVLAPRDPHNPQVALRDVESPVARAINFVNYLANWTATLILVQSKVKARARIVEKLLSVAAALREQENFDSLMGVLAGLNSQPVFRLTETMELVTTKLDGDPRANPQRTAQPDGDKHRLPKKLRSLNRLMSASKSFAAYRLALANSGVHMIPYLGVHLQDLTVSNEMKSDMRGGLVNWSKMSQMGKSAAIVLDCARVAPKLPVDRTIERCILNVPVLDEDRQYTLSYAHQPRQSDKTGTRARLREFAKSTFV